MDIIGVCFWITTKCNLRCNICYADLNSVKNSSLSEYLNIIDKLREFNVKKIAFTGGDPLLVRNVDDILKYSHNLGFKVAVTTNAHLLNEQKLNNLEKYIDEISIPMDGYSKKVSDIHRTIKHDHFNVMDIIRISKNYDILIDVSTVVTQYNKNELIDILKYLSGHNIYKWKIFQYSKLDEPKYNIINFNLSNKEFNDITESILEYKKDNKLSIGIDFRNNSTESINSYINILPDGGIILGYENEYKNVGNILDYKHYSDFTTMLNSNNFSFHHHRKRHHRDI